MDFKFFRVMSRHDLIKTKANTNTNTKPLKRYLEKTKNAVIDLVILPFHC